LILNGVTDSSYNSPTPQAKVAHTVNFIQTKNTITLTYKMHSLKRSGNPNK